MSKSGGRLALLVSTCVAAGAMAGLSSAQAQAADPAPQLPSAGAIGLPALKVQGADNAAVVEAAPSASSTVSRAQMQQILPTEPGDILTTGTPPGVGEGQKPEKIFLKAGDVMELGIEKLGSQRQNVIAWTKEGVA